MSSRRGLIGTAVGVGAAAAGAALVADRKVEAQRRAGGAEQDRFAEPRPDRQGFLRTGDGVELRYVEEGPAHARVTVVFVHGFCLDHNDFLFQRQGLRARYGDRVRLLAYDQRGHGASGPAASARATIDDLGDDLFTVLQELVPTGPVVLVGHSMGGMTVMALADRHRELFGPAGRVAGVALLSTSTGKLSAVTLGLPAALAKLRGPVLPVLLRGARRQHRLVERGRTRTTDVAWVFVKRLAFGPDVDPGLVEFVSGLIAATRIDVIADFYPALMGHDKLAALDVLRRTPVAVVCGDRDLMTPPEHSAVIAAALPRARLVTVPDTGHQAHMERPDLVEPALCELVDTALRASSATHRPYGPRPANRGRGEGGAA